MKINQLNSMISVSEQISISDVLELKEQGVQMIVCNRPDNESENQVAFEHIESAAKLLEIKAVHIPFVAGNMNQQHINELSDVLNLNVKVHLYCRTGNRSKLLFEACDSRSESQAMQADKMISEAKPHYDVVIVGAGSGGIATAASLLKRRPDLRLAVIDPAEFHYYQPGWTMVGGGVFDVASTKKPMAGIIPHCVTWIQQSVTAFKASDNYVKLADESEVYYDHLVVSAGLTLNWNGIEGLPETLGKNGVTSNYRYDLAPYTWELVSQLKKGKAIFTQPPMPIKCAGAPQKALYLSADTWFKQGLASDIDIHFYNAGGVLFGVKEYVPALTQYMQKYQVDLHYSHTLVKIDGPSKTAWFSCKTEDGTETTVSTNFDMIHVCPPQCAPEFIQKSTLTDENGWLDVDKHTLQHVREKNVWGLGDITNTPNAKTMAAVRKQAPVVAQNICDAIAGKLPSVAYDGYGSCPLTVERGKIVLAEFTYGGKLAPSFPSWLNDGTKPTRLAWSLKASILPPLYWYGMLKGREWMAAPQRLTEEN